jgi:hypothetical protein
MSVKAPSGQYLERVYPLAAGTQLRIALRFRMSFKFMCGTMGWVCARSPQFPRAWSLGCTPAS